MSDIIIASLAGRGWLIFHPSRNYLLLLDNKMSSIKKNHPIPCQEMLLMQAVDFLYTPLFKNLCSHKKDPFRSWLHKDYNITLPKMFPFQSTFFSIKSCETLFCVNTSCVQSGIIVLIFHSEVNRREGKCYSEGFYKLKIEQLSTSYMLHLPACPDAVCSVTFDFFHIVFFSWV